MLGLRHVYTLLAPRFLGLHPPPQRLRRGRCGRDRRRPLRHLCGLPHGPGGNRRGPGRGADAVGVGLGPKRGLPAPGHRRALQPRRRADGSRARPTHSPVEHREPRAHGGGHRPGGHRLRLPEAREPPAGGLGPGGARARGVGRALGGRRLRGHPPDRFRASSIASARGLHHGRPPPRRRRASPCTLRARHRPIRHPARRATLREQPRDGARCGQHGRSAGSDRRG